jgi:pantothenate kinase
MVYRFSQIATPVENPFRHDALGRQETVDFVADLVERTGKNGPFVLAIDAPYGSGKSTFIAMLRAVLTRRDFYSVQFNAWQVDNSEDPLVPMVSVLDSAMRTELAVESRLAKSLDVVRRVTTIVAKRGVVAAAKTATLGGLDLIRNMRPLRQASQVTQQEMS